jgi:hypothetical protein
MFDRLDKSYIEMLFVERTFNIFFRFRRDADEQLVLAHVWNKLANVVQILTIHIFKDDWLHRQTHTFMQTQTGNQLSNSNSSNYSNFVVTT